MESSAPAVSLDPKKMKKNISSSACMYACKLEGMSLYYNIAETMVARVHEILVVLLGRASGAEQINVGMYIFTPFCTVNCYSFHFF